MPSIITIRPERIDDTQAVAEVNRRAFDGLVEPVIAALARQHRSYDPALSLVAEQDGQVIGHALFLQHRMRLLGESVPAVSLGPIAVAPGLQKQGVGGQLIAAGHQAARERGCVLSFLLGHDTYYPRFGYRTRQHGASALELTRAMLGPGAHGTLQRRAPTEADLPALLTLWAHEESAVDFALHPGPSLLDWVSPHPQIASQVWLHGETLIGYTRIHQAEPHAPRCFLARDDESARAMAFALLTDHESIRLPLHPASASAAAFPAQPVAAAWSAGMACPLIPGVLDAFSAPVEAGARPPGRVIWPVMFDLA
jgi:predicted N-acetyltransferase YhbS